ncbi:MAG: hypothetical protein K6E83_00875 [Clostridium sp.]|nr:hypothetical protein [Clostridium sp.]
MVVFENPGKENAEKALRIGIAKAAEIGAPAVVLPSGTGETGMLACRIRDKLGYQGKLVVVRTVSKAALSGGNKMTPEMKGKLEAKGVTVVSCAHALSAGERGISGKFQGVYPLELMAATLRTFGQGMKVAFECAVMALDTDAIPYGVPVVALGGSSFGVDTAAVITPGYSADILDTRVHEVLCKPGLYEP